MQSIVEAFLVIEQPRQRHGHWSSALARLDDRRAPPLLGVSAFYDVENDQALLGLRYDEAVLGRDGLAFVVEVALLEEIGMIQPAELTEGDRLRFLSDRLARCALHVGERPTVVETLADLVRRIRAHKKPPASPSKAFAPRGDTQDPVLLVQARGTRENLDKVERSPGRDGAISAHVIARTGTKDQHRAPTVEVPATEAYRRAQASMTIPTRTVAPATPAAPARATSPSELPTDAGATPQGIIYARYLRSGRWVPIRIGALSLKGAALLTGALPRVNDHVDVALSFGSHRALVRGNVGKVSSPTEAAASGTSTFSVSFELDDASRRQLTSLLTAARAANVTIKPPPPRAARRFPVEWPVGLGTSRGVVRAEALDLSKDGMFVRPVHALTLDARVSFSTMLDDGQPVSGRAQVVRHLAEPQARAASMASGYGLKITEMGDDDRARWIAFLARIERRSERRVLVGAAPARLAELQSSLAAVGYAVTGGTDPSALVQLASAEARPVDAALIDVAWLSPTMSAEWVEQLFAARNVPCVTLHGDLKRARAAVDKLLLAS